MSAPRGGSRPYPSVSANVAAASGFAVVLAAAMIIPGGATYNDILVGVPSFMFMAYLALALVSTRRARAEEDQRNAASVLDHVAQCEKALLLIAEAARGPVADFRAYMALGQLATTIRLFVTSYGRYLKDEGVWAALEAESLVMMAELSDRRSLESQIGPIRDYVREIGRNVIGADDPRLAAIQAAP